MPCAHGLCSGERSAGCLLSSGGGGERRKIFDICFGEWLLTQETTYKEEICSFVQIFLLMPQTNISTAQKTYLQSLKSTVLSLYRVEETARENHIVIRQILSDTQKVLRVQYNPVLPNLYAGEIVGLRLLSTDEGHSSGYGVYRFPPDIQDKLCMSAEQVYAAVPAAKAAEKDEHMREVRSIIEEIIIRTWSAMTSSFNAKMRSSLQKKHS